MNLNRVTVLNQPKTKQNVLYIITKAFRVNDNHALEYAQSLVDKNHLSIYLYRQQEENQRNNRFFEEGISNYSDAFSSFSKNIEYYRDTFDFSLLDTFDCVISDGAYLIEDRAFEKELTNYCQSNGIGHITVETNVVVPVRVVSNKEEYSARTIRPKIWKKFADYVDLNTQYSDELVFEKKAIDILQAFVDNTLKNYDLRNHPEYSYTSNLSVYLKYGFISPLTIYNHVWGHPSHTVDEFLEELIVRRDLAYNFVYYNQGYNDFEKMTYSWAHQTMKVHEFDHRQYIYTVEDYISFKTHDPYFNAAMKEMVLFGEMKGYMRMYWAKKVIEWSRTFEEAYQILLYLNNYYFLDGNTPNGYTGVAWCFGKHDRAWVERPIFGKLRYMNDNGLKRKFDIEKYVSNIEKKAGNIK